MDDWIHRIQFKLFQSHDNALVVAREFADVLPNKF